MDDYTPLQRRYLKHLREHGLSDELPKWLPLTVYSRWDNDAAFQLALLKLDPRRALQEVIGRGLMLGNAHALGVVVQAVRALVALDEDQPLPVGSTGGNTMKTQRRLAKVLSGKQDNVVEVVWPHPDDHEKVFDGGKH